MASGPRNNNKWKEYLKGEGAHSKASPVRRLKVDVSAELAAPEASSLGKTVPPSSPSSFPIKGTSRDKGLLPPSSSPIKGTSRDANFLSPSFPLVEGTSQDVRGQGLPKPRGVLSDHIPIKSGSIRADETRPVFVGLTFEEAQRLSSAVSFC